MKVHAMLKTVCAVLLLFFLCTLTACTKVENNRQGNENAPLAGEITIQQWLDAKGNGKDFTIRATIQSIENPAWAIIADDTAEVHLFGVMLEGKFQSFLDAGLEVGDTLVLQNGVYNVYENIIEMKEAILLEWK